MPITAWFEWLSNVDTFGSNDLLAEWFRGIVLSADLHDRRGTGASGRNVGPPNLETRAGADHAATVFATSSP
jgi:hypothetical protein